MANFGFRDLSVVAPYEPHWREACSAVGAEDLLQDANVSTTLAEAVAACTLVIGTGTLTHRKPEQPVVPLPLLAPLVAAELVKGGRVALVFGPEKHGLTREDLSWCQLLVEIPTDSHQPSMNLGQAVAVCLYELASRAFPARSVAAAHISMKGTGFSPYEGIAESSGALAPEASSSQNLSSTQPDSIASAAVSGNLNLLAEVIEETMLAAGYSPRSMQAANRHDLRLLLRRLAPGERDTRRILGLFRRILWRLKHRSENC
jgi:tRNA/rRNA methyltransferase